MSRGLKLTGPRGRRRAAGLLGVFSAAALALLAAVAAPDVASAATISTMKVSPAGQTVAAGAPFQIDVIGHAGVATSQAQVDVSFDPSLVSITAVKLGKPWTSATFLYAIGVGNLADAVKAANASGTLTIGAALPSTVPAGDNTFVTIAFQAANGPGGTSSIRLRHAVMLDATQNDLPVLVSSSTVTVTPGAAGSTAASPSGSVGPSSGKTPVAPSPCPSTTPATGSSGSPSASGSAASETPAASATSCVSASPSPATSPAPASAPTATVYVVPDKDKLAVGDKLVVTLYSNSDNPLSSIAVDFVFDRSILQVVSIDATGEWPGSTINQPRKNVLTALIQRANAGNDPTNPSRGVLQGIGVNVPEQGGDASVSGSFLTITMKAVGNGKVTLSALNVSAIDTSGGQEDSPSEHNLVAEVVVGSSGTSTGGAGGGFSLNVDWPLVISAAILLLEIVGCLLLLVLPARVVRSGFGIRLPSRPYVISLFLGLIPVILFAGCVAIVVVNAWPAFTDPGLPAFFDTQSVSVYSTNGALTAAYGLLPALCGTVMIVGIALLVALPVSLSLALVTTEFPIGPIGRILRPLVTLMSGIPPIVYAVSMFVFVQLLMIPKFAANSTYETFGNGAAIGANPSTWPPAGVPFNAGSYPWEPTLGNSTFLGGLLVGLLLIPFLTPMIADAIRNVPNTIREASLALGANRTYTVRRALLPAARPAIVSAVALGMLKAAGDVVIVAFAVGWSADAIPDPIVDVFARTPSLAVHAADMIVPLETPGSTNQPPLPAVGYVGALVLLVLAMVVIVLMHFLRRRLTEVSDR